MDTNYKLITVKDLSEMLGISTSSIYRRLNERGRFYDPCFPKPVKLGDTTSRWVLSEVVNWLQVNLERRKSA